MANQVKADGRKLKPWQVKEVMRQAEIMSSRKVVPGMDKEDLYQELCFAGCNTGRNWDPDKGDRPFGAFVRADMKFHFGHIMAGVNRNVRKTNHRAKKFGSPDEFQDGIATERGGEWDYVSSPFNQRESHESEEVKAQRERNRKIFEAKGMPNRAYSDDELDRMPGYEGDGHLVTQDENPIDVVIYGLGLDPEEQDAIVLRHLAKYGMGYNHPKREVARILGIEVSQLNKSIKRLRSRQDLYTALEPNS